ncbi:hypothetical protein BDV36DRAFT_297508 [Aspergillus pseudocaelatus]|uniref:Invertebrate defensins family profile domain-containing protein n=1 Tax=Aspergillus pseudocaelatus TaxID=1825620 RepID=A0ABQ6WKC7_9EURO|nr:hypothetical protein BDV36DRAFT_297508 [Aspergillus pseudocaelatus]
MPAVKLVTTPPGLSLPILHTEKQKLTIITEDEVIEDYNPATEMATRDTFETRAYPRCLSYADCKGGWCHKGNCLDNVCKGANMCPKGFLCDGANCYKHKKPWVYDGPP